jgi:hypothetical protein
MPFHTPRRRPGGRRPHAVRIRLGALVVVLVFVTILTVLGGDPYVAVGVAASAVTIVTGWHTRRCHA